MSTTAAAINQKEVLVPISLLKYKVERDHDEWMFFYDPSNDNLDDDGLETHPDPFPQYESTKQILQILKKEGIEFDPVLGCWNK